MFAMIGKLTLAVLMAAAVAGGAGTSPTIGEQVKDAAVRKSLDEYVKLRSSGSLGGIDFKLTTSANADRAKLFVYYDNTGGKPAVEQIKIGYALCGAKFEKGRWVTTCTKGGAKTEPGPAPGQNGRKQITVKEPTEYNRFAYQVPNVTISLSTDPEKKLKLATLKVQQANLP
jgi:hypothetical protein